MGRYEGDDDYQPPTVGGGDDEGGAFTSLSGDAANTVTFGVNKEHGNGDSRRDPSSHTARSSAPGAEPGEHAADAPAQAARPRVTPPHPAPAQAGLPAAPRRRKTLSKVGTWFYLFFSLVLAVAILHYLGFINIPSIYADAAKSFAKMKAELPPIHYTFTLPDPLVSFKNKMVGTAAPAPANKTQSKTAYPTPGPGPNTCVVLGTANDYLRVRAQPNKSAQIIDGLAPGQRVEVLEWGPEWNKVKVKDAVGYVAGAYCKREE